MADIKISELGAASAVNSNDIFPITSAGVTVKATAQQIKNYIGVGNLANLNTTDKSSAVNAINEVNTKFSKTEALISIVENGNTCTHTGGIAQGQYVNWKGDLYTADSNISVGATFASSGGSKNLTAVTDGGLNKLANQYLGSFTVSGLESYLLTMLTNMSYYEKKYVSFVISTPSGVFRNAFYQGIFTKTNDVKYEIIVWADDRIEYITGAYYGNTMHWGKMAKDSDCAKMEYIEPAFTNGLATYDMTSILSKYGYSRLTSVVAQVEGSGYTTGVYIAKSSISQNTNIKLTLATTSYSGVIGVTVIFKGN